MNVDIFLTETFILHPYTSIMYKFYYNNIQFFKKCFLTFTRKFLYKRDKFLLYVILYFFTMEYSPLYLFEVVDAKMRY